MTTIFKFVKDGVTRRVPYSHRPDWTDVAQKLSAFYSIPLDKVAVSYIDADGDEVTLSTSDELQDYYSSVLTNQPFKFHVKDLRVNHVEPKNSIESLAEESRRNTFGIEPDLRFDIDDDWHFASAANDTGIPHGYVETLPSDASSISSHSPSVRSQSSTSSAATARIPLDNKGKGRASAANAWTETSPATSVLAGSENLKPEIHILGHGAFKDTLVSSQKAPSVKSDKTSTASTAQSVKAEEAKETEFDPPLPELAPVDGAQSVGDVASVLTSLVGAITAGDGENRKRFEALGSFIRTFADLVDPPNHGEPSQETLRRPPHPHRPLHRQEHSWFSQAGPPFMHPPPPPPHGGWGHRGPHGPPPPPPPPGPPPHAGPPPPPPPPHHGHHHHHGHPWRNSDGQQQHILSGQTPQELRRNVESAKEIYKAEKEKYRREREARRAEVRASQAQAQVPQTPRALPIPQAPGPIEVAANARGPFPSFDVVSVPRRHNTISGPMERRRAVPEGLQPIGESPLRRGGSTRSAVEHPIARSTFKILKKLSDMGFTEQDHHDLSYKVKTQLGEGPYTREREDDIVTNLLEEMVMQSPKPGPAASSSHIPSVWQL